MQLWLLLLLLEAAVTYPGFLPTVKKTRSIEWQSGFGLLLSALTIFWVWNLVNTVVQLRNQTKPLQASLGIFPFVSASWLLGLLWLTFVQIVRRSD